MYKTSINEGLFADSLTPPNLSRFLIFTNPNDKTYCGGCS